MSRIKKLIVSVYFQIGVNVIGLPEIYSHKITLYNNLPVIKSKYIP